MIYYFCNLSARAGEKAPAFSCSRKNKCRSCGIENSFIAGASLWLVPYIKYIKLTSCKLALASDYEGIPASMERNQGLSLTDSNYDFQDLYLRS